MTDLVDPVADVLPEKPLPSCKAICMQKQNFWSIVTGDELRFFLGMFMTFDWSQSRDDLHSQPKQNIQTEKCLVLMVWSSRDLHGRFTVPKGDNYNSTFFAIIVVPDVQTKLCSGA
jgi:hypothetical protein